MPSISAKLLLVVGLAWCAILPTAGVAQTIKFSTADGKFEVSGKVAGFIRGDERIPRKIQQSFACKIEANITTQRFHECHKL